MQVLSFFDDRRVVILRRENKIIAYNKLSLETCIGRGEPIELEIGDMIQNKFDREWEPKGFRIPLWLEKKILVQQNIH